MKQPIIVIAGPTASGKTDLAIKLAKKYNGEIICADSRSIYKGMDIGTAKPTPEEQRQVPHHLLDLVEPDQAFSAAEFKKLAETKIKDILSRNKVVFIVGGSGLYIDSIVYDYKFPKASDIKHKKSTMDLTNEQILSRIKKIDGKAAKSLTPHNRGRLERAYHIIKFGLGSRKRLESLPKNVLYLAIDTDRAVLYERINKRNTLLFKQGFVQEVKQIIDKYGFEIPGLSGIGYRELTDYYRLQQSLGEALENFKKGDRNLAKRQLTWLRRNKDVRWVKSQDDAERLIDQFLR